MFQEIKYYLFKIFLTQKKKLAILTCFVFLGLFIVPQITHAFALDLANMQLDALDFIDNSVLKWLIFIALLAIESVALLNISANLLDWSSALPVNLGNPSSPNPLVDAGWHFTSGLANLAFILIFIVIVLSYILKFDNFKMKQALPRLIIIALLINFSLLFVKMLADIGWVFQNSFSSAFLEEGTGLAEAAASALTASTWSLAGVILGVPIAYMTVAWIPYVNVIALTAIAFLVLGTGGAGGIVGGALIGTISQTIMVIVLNFTVGFIFLVFAALFLVRIAAIWLLAIFAPLAFMAFILPSTKKYFDQWMKALVQWIFLGVVVYFLLGLGLMLFGLVAPGSEQAGSFGDLGKFSDIFYKYIFLVIYMIVVFVVSKKLVPIGGQMIWGFSEMATKKFGQWSGSKMGAGLSGAQDWIGKSVRERLPEGTRKWGERQALVPSWGEGVGGIKGVLMRGVSTPFYRSRRAIGMAVGPTGARLEKEKIARVEKSIGADEGLPELLKRYRETQDNATRIALLNTIIKRKNIDDAMDASAFARRYNISPAAASGLVLTNQEVEKRMGAARSWGVDGTMKAAFPNIARQNLPAGVPPTARPPGISQAQHSAQYVFDGIKLTDYENMSKSTLRDNEFVEALIRKGKSNHLRQFIDRFGMEGSRAIEERIQVLAQAAGQTPINWLIAANPAISKYLRRGAGADLFNI